MGRVKQHLTRGRHKSLVPGDHFISYPTGPGKAMSSFPLRRRMTASFPCMDWEPRMAGRFEPEPVAMLPVKLSRLAGSSLN